MTDQTSLDKSRSRKTEELSQIGGDQENTATQWSMWFWNRKRAVMEKLVKFK